MVKNKNIHKKEKKMITTLVFDLDGTLLNTIEDLMISTNYALEKYHYPVHTLDEIKTYVGSGIRKLIERSLPEKEATKDFDEVFKTFQNHYSIHKEDHTAPYQGIHELLVSLKQKNYKMAIVSNKFQQGVVELCTPLFGEEIEVMLGEQEDKGIHKKPAPDMVDMALKTLGSTKEESIYIGDSDIDVLTAKNSQLDFIGCSWGFRGRAFLENMGVTKIADNPKDILSLIEK
jgi:phosphoglycolate phosphatase